MVSAESNISLGSIVEP